MTSNIYQTTASSPTSLRSRAPATNVGTLLPDRAQRSEWVPQPSLGNHKTRMVLSAPEFTSPPAVMLQYLPETLPCLFSTAEPEEEGPGAAESAQAPRRWADKSRKLFPPRLPLARLGQRAFHRRGRSRLGILTGLSPLCPLSSRALWQALCLPHPAVVRSSGPRLEGTLRPPRACRPAPVLLPRLAPSGAQAQRAAPRLPRARRRAHPGRQPGHVRAATIGPSERGRAAKEGRGGPKRSDSLFPQPRRRRKSKRKPVELVSLREEANWPSR